MSDFNDITLKIYEYVHSLSSPLPNIIMLGDIPYISDHSIILTETSLPICTKVQLNLTLPQVDLIIRFQ